MGLNTGNKIASYMNTKIKLNERLVAGAYSTFALVLDDKDNWHLHFAIAFFNE